MSTVIGLDCSLTCTGVAVIHRDDLTPELHSVRSTGKAGDNLARRGDRIRALVRGVLAHVEADTALVMIEAPSYGSTGGSAWDRAYVWWSIVNGCQRRGVPIVSVSPSTAKKFASGSGRGDKTDVAAGMARLWPSAEPHGDDEWDALTLATMGAQRLGWDVPRLARHEDCMRPIQWPEEVARG